MTERVVFWLNAQDQIVSVGCDWNFYAKENEAPELSGRAFTGRPLLEFLPGKVTRTFVQTMLQLARERMQLIELDCRCDSPSFRRNTRMRGVIDVAGGTVFVRETLRTKARACPVGVGVGVANQRGRHTSIRCSMCNLVKPANAWLVPRASSSDKCIRNIAVVGDLQHLRCLCAATGPIYWRLEGAA